MPNKLHRPGSGPAIWQTGKKKDQVVFAPCYNPHKLTAAQEKPAKP
jgi:hypothetical protein